MPNVKASYLASAAFAAIAAWAAASVAQDFHGYDCTDDCSGHEAGYEWAEEKGIDDADDCGGNSQSFIEGCIAWAEEHGSAVSYEEALDDEGEEDE